MHVICFIFFILLSILLTLHRSAADIRQMDRSVTDDVSGPRSRTGAVPPRQSSSSLPPPATAESTPVVVTEWMSGGVIAVTVLGLLCLVLGVVYAYIYFTRINPRAGRTAAGAGRSSRKSMSQANDEGASSGVSTHLFLFKRS